MITIFPPCCCGNVARNTVVVVVVAVLVHLGKARGGDSLGACLQGSSSTISSILIALTAMLKCFSLGSGQYPGAWLVGYFHGGWNHCIPGSGTCRRPGTEYQHGLL